MNLDSKEFSKLVGDRWFDNCLFLGGGTDVDASLYNQPKHPKASKPDTARDKWCIENILRAQARGVPVIGICRGSQMLGVYNGNRLHQHCLGETGGNAHIIGVNRYRDTEYTDEFEGMVTHHQTLEIIATGAKMLARSIGGQDGIDSNGDTYRIRHVPQVVYYPLLKHLGIQFHAEWMPQDCTARIWLRKIIHESTGLVNIC